ncbi:hypothetical protein ASO20_02015 [Mycoplasma sp. (ex Biomphalaria glabrata)]|uniref:hypothetical protein n=1 Tax=Mycoplasma sp. (ex Biomphalaria glabrata) TaxID=1749074 RepID=UPI00073ABE5A|nr:hypothetical protein [Mycoplasma sp. (ex Biomphalaria glabrata)]ALV23419.1 hypothetical protein ASO20_02015 [Mycoplasma sp. (ex Biomphalaria glabrata)]
MNKKIGNKKRSKFVKLATLVGVSLSMIPLAGFTLNNNTKNVANSVFNIERKGDKLNLTFNFLNFEKYLIYNAQLPIPTDWKPLQQSSSFPWSPGGTGWDTSMGYTYSVNTLSQDKGLGNPTSSSLTDTQAISDRNLKELTTWLENVKNQTNTSGAKIVVAADCVNCSNPSQDGEQLGSFPIDPSYYDVKDGNGSPTNKTPGTISHNPVDTASFTLGYTSIFRLSFHFDISATKDSSILVSMADGWLSNTAAKQFEDFIQTGKCSPQLYVGSWFQFPITYQGWLTEKVQGNDDSHQNLPDGYFFNLWTVPGNEVTGATMGVVSYIFIAASILIILGLFTPAYIRAIRRW